MYMKSWNEILHNGDRIKEIRERTGLTQKEFSSIYHIPLNTYRNWEQNKTELPDYVFELLHRAVSEDEEQICQELSEDETLKDGWKNFFKKADLSEWNTRQF